MLSKQQPVLYTNFYKSKMDFGFQKRMKFRQSIRQRKIQQIKKTRRQLYQQYIQQHKQQIQQELLYQRVVNNSQEIFKQGENYLQMLRQALNWQKSNKLKHMFSEVLLNIIKFYDECQLTQNVTILLIECIATIYYHGKIQFGSLTKRSLLICYQQLQINKTGEMQASLLKNRCLVAILNITSTQNKEILHACQQIFLLERLEQMLQDFPCEDNNKVNIMGIYGNIINFHLQYQAMTYNQPPQYYPFLLKQCIEQNYNLQVLNKAVQTIINLFQCKLLDKFDIIQNIESIYYLLLQAGFYVEDSQDLLCSTAEFMFQSSQIQNNFEDCSRIVCNLGDLLELLVLKYTQKLNISSIGKSFFYMAMLSSKYFQQSREQKLQQLTRKICNFWIQFQDDSSYEFQLSFLKLLYESMSNPNLCKDLCKQWEMGICQQNSIKAPTWEIMMQFLSSLELQQPNKMWAFLSVLSFQHLIQLTDESYRVKFLQKIEGCFYNGLQNRQISSLAQKLLKNYTQDQQNL